MPKLEDHEQTELCKDCLFIDLCTDINLPHCEGKDYIKQRED